MYNISPDVLGIKETRLDSTVTDNAVCIDGYNVFRKDRNRLGGGICLYVKCIHNSCVRNDVLSDDLEVIWVEFTFLKSKNLLVVSLYRPPSSCLDYLKHISNNFEAGLSESKHCIIMGDFNFDCGNANNLEEVMELCDLLNLSQLIFEPTRLTPESTIIEYIYTNTANKHVYSGVI